MLHNGYVKVTQVFRIERHRVPKAVAQRKKWTKFGDVAGEPSGPNRTNTQIADEVFLTLTSNREVRWRERECRQWGKEGEEEVWYSLLDVFYVSGVGATR